MKFPRYYLKLIEDIYNQLYEKLYDDKIHCFLCGSNNMTFRNKLTFKLENKDIKAIYAENLFSALVHNQSKENHLDLEDILASNVELILIILEGPGALVELGMFCKDKNHLKKLMVLMDAEYRDQESFINYGPIKKLKELDNINRVFYYNTEETGEKQLNAYQERKLSKSLNIYKDRDLNITEKQVLDIISMYYFLKVVLFIINPADKAEISNLLKYISTSQKMDIKDEEIELNIDSVLYWLQKEDYINKVDDTKYKLTKKGIIDTKKELYGVFGTRLIDNYRAQALNYTLRIKDKIS